MLDFETMVAEAHRKISIDAQLHAQAKAVSAEVEHLLTPIDELCRQAGTQFRVSAARNHVYASIGLGRGARINLRLELYPTHSIARLDDGPLRSLAHYDSDAELAEVFLDGFRDKIAYAVRKLVARIAQHRRSGA